MNQNPFFRPVSNAKPLKRTVVNKRIGIIHVMKPIYGRPA